MLRKMLELEEEKRGRKQLVIEITDLLFSQQALVISLFF